ncbi:MAG: PPC domain-containing protein [Elainellaceae cyanobacterium]
MTKLKIAFVSCLGILGFEITTLLSGEIALSQPIYQIKQNNSQVILQQQGRLTADDSILPSDGSLYDEYSFEGRAGQQITISLESSDFDTYLILLGPNNEVLAQNDDVSATNLNSSLTVTLPSNGTYRVIANSYSSGDRGRYTLIATEAGQGSSLSEISENTQSAPQRPRFQTYVHDNKFSIQHPEGSEINVIPNYGLEIRSFSGERLIKTMASVQSGSFEENVNRALVDESDMIGTLTRRGDLTVGGREAIRLWFSEGQHFYYTITTVIRYSNSQTILVSTFYDDDSPSTIEAIQDIHWSLRILE